MKGSLMGSLNPFKSPKVPSVPIPPAPEPIQAAAPVTVANSSSAKAASGQRQRAAAAAAAGTVGKSGAGGLKDSPKTSTVTLLGQ